MPRLRKKLNVQWSAMSKVERPASAQRSMASTAASRSILPQPPLVCHMPLRTRHISSESFPFFTVTRRPVASSVVAVVVFEQHFTELGLSCCLESENRVEVMSLVEFLDLKRLTPVKTVDEAICRKTKNNACPNSKFQHTLKMNLRIQFYIILILIRILEICTLKKKSKL